MVVTLEEYIKQELAKHGPPRFKPVPSYWQNGDFIEWYWFDERCFAEQINHDGQAVGAVMRSMEHPEKVVGVKIFCAKLLVQQRES